MDERGVYARKGDICMFSKGMRTGLLFVILLLTLSLGAFAQTERKGTYVDEVVILQVDEAQALSRLRTGDIDIYAMRISNPTLYAEVLADPNLAYSSVIGSYSELTFNPVGPVLRDGTLNPFASRRLREAMNWLVDRNYIAQELYGGLAKPKLTVLTPEFADYARVIEKMRELEVKYAYNPGRAQQVIDEEMTAMGAVKVNGKWHYNGQPVTIKILARIEDERRLIGDYFAQQLEKVGFTTVVDYKRSSEAAPIWQGSDPWDGLWHVYTGGWSSPMVYRSQAHNFDQMYTRRVMPVQPWQSLEPIPELDEISARLRYSEFNSMEERKALLERALELGLQDSPRIFLVDQISFIPRRKDISVATDLGGGVMGTGLWAPTLRKGNQPGGTVRIGIPVVLDQPWNPIAPANSLYDTFVIRGIMDRSTITDPYTGNYWANRVEYAEVEVLEGLPVAKSLDWVKLSFVPEIKVPEDAWVDWDAAQQRIITVGEKYPEGVTAKVHYVMHFPEDFWETVKWHDGSPVTIGDIIHSWILGLDRAKPESPLYDEQAAAEWKAAEPSYKGWRIVSLDPFVVEGWSDSWALDAEYNIGEFMPVDINYGPIPWHTVAVASLAEANKELAFSGHKANQLNVVQTSFFSGPSLSILKKYLDKAKAENYIPYASVLGKYITPEEAATRYENLSKWVAAHDHFALGTGVLYIDRIYPVEQMIVMKRNPDHPDSADKWSIFGEPMIPEIEVVSAGRLRVAQRDEAIFEVVVKFKGELYPEEYIREVKYLIQDSKGNVVATGPARALGNSRFVVELLPDQTARLPIGSNRIDFIVTTDLVGGATFASATFVTTPAR